MTRVFTIAFSIWALIGLVAYRPHFILGLQKVKLFSSNTKSAPKPKLRKLAKSYKIKNKHSQLMAKLTRTKKVKPIKGNLEGAFKTLTTSVAKVETKTPALTKKENIQQFFQEPAPQLFNDSNEDVFSTPPQIAPQQISQMAPTDTIDSEFADNSSETVVQVPPPEPNDSIWSQDDLMTAFDQININVLQYGADYKSAFQQLSDDVLASATGEQLKGKMLDQIQKEYDAYTAYFDGSQISSL